MPQLVFSIFSGGGDDHTGDSSVRSDGTPNDFDSEAAFGHVGRLAKGGDEFNAFFAYDTSAVALGSRIDGVNFEFSATGVAVGNSNDIWRLAFVKDDGVWDVNGIALASQVSAGPSYALAHKFPNDGTAVPHVTQDGSDVLEPEVIFGWATGDLQLITAILFSGAARFGVGNGTDGQPSLQEVQTLFPLIFNASRNARGQAMTLVTIDSMSVGNAAHYAEVYFRDDATSSRHPTLVVKFTLNPPDITSSPPLSATYNVLYTYTVVATPYVLGDQTAGNFLDVTFSLEGVAGVDFPVGMTINATSGLVSWTPQAYQAEANTVSVRATNEGGQFDDQVFEVVVLIPDPGTMDTTDDLVATAEPHAITAEATANAITAEATANAITAEDQAQTITAEATAQRITATVVSGDITAESD